MEEIKKVVLVLGANGFMGKHICLHLCRSGHNVLKYDLDSSIDELKDYISKCDFIIHVAGVNRPEHIEDFYKGNTEFTRTVVSLVKESGKQIPIIYSSSIQAELDNDYGKSKKQAEEILFESELPVYVYRISNAFGKWGKPNYNSACATFCYNIAHDLPVYVRDENYIVHYNYIDDICDEFIKKTGLLAPLGSKNLLKIEPTYDCSLGHLVELLRYFKSEIESERHIPYIHNEFELKLFKTFCNYLTEDDNLNYNKDHRGSFEELYKSKKWGQISENIILPGITKGGHYHKRKKEIFETVIGENVIIQKDTQSDRTIKNLVSEHNPLRVDILTNYIHEISNLGKEESHTLMWISEIYNESDPDTYRE